MDEAQRDLLGIKIARQQAKLVRELQAARTAAGLSVADVARDMGVDEAVVYRFEKGGTKPTLATVRRYALAVGAMVEFGARPLGPATEVSSNHIRPKAE